LERGLIEWMLMRYRVDELAAQGGVSGDTIRFYHVLQAVEAGSLSN
jgi:hypothetical protein